MANTRDQDDERARRDREKDNQQGLPLDVDQEIPAEPPDTDPVDHYTGEVDDMGERGDENARAVLIDSFANETEATDMPEDVSMDLVLSDSNSASEAVMDQIDNYTEDPDILADFAERQGLASGSAELYDSLLEHTDIGPILSGGDVDADWEMANVSGEEAVGGSVATPDQDVVEDLGRAVGVEYKDNEDLGTADKLVKRDEKRWELDPRSAEEGDKEMNDLFNDGDEEDLDLDDF